MLTLIAVALISCVVPVLTLSAMLSRHHLSWVPRYEKEEHVAVAGEGAFRSTELQTNRWKVVGDGLPLPVAIAAFTSFFVGQMVAPATPLALLGFAISLEKKGVPQAMNIWLLLYSLLFIPGAVCAVQTFRMGLALLRGQRAAAEKTIRWNTLVNLSHNAIFAMGVGAAKMSGVHDIQLAYFGLGYAAIVVVHTVIVHAIFHHYQSKFVA